MRQWIALFPPSFLLLFCIAGAVTGAVVYTIAGLIFKRGDRTGWYLAGDSALGVLGFLAGVFGSTLIRIAPSAVTTRVQGVVVRRTSMHYQHPYAVAFGIAILLAAGLECIRILAARSWKRVGEPTDK